MTDRLFVSLEGSLENQEAVEERGSFFQRIARAWLRFSGPNRDRFSSSLADQERLRRSRILSALLPLVIIAAVIAAPTAIPVPTYWIPILLLVISGLFALLLNRAALIHASGIVLILAIDAALTLLMVTLPHGIRNSNIPDFDLFLIATLIGGVALPRRLLPFLAAFHILLIFLLFALLPHDPLLTREIQINQQGLAYGELSDAFLLQIIGTSIAWLSAWSVDRALLRASRAEELAKAQQYLRQQIQMQAEQNARLEYGIQVLKEAHARFANGDYKARANLHDNELASLAFSFNLLAERLNRVAQAAQDYERLEQAFQQLFAIQEAMIYRGTLQPLTPTGTLADRTYPWLKQSYQLRQLSTRCGEAVDQQRAALARQRTLLIQLTSALDQTHGAIQQVARDPKTLASALASLERSQQLCQQVEEQGKQCVRGTKQLEQLLKPSLTRPSTSQEKSTPPQ